MEGDPSPAPPVLGDRGWQLPAHDLLEFGPRRTRFCVCVPVINENGRIIAQLRSMAPGAALADILILDGGSTDGSLAPAFLQEHGVRALLTKRGPGRLSAQLRMGYAWALRQGYEGIVTIDGNNKDDPAAIPAFCNAPDRGFDLIQGSRFVAGGRAINTPLGRLLAIRLVHAPLVSVGGGFAYTDTTNGFRGYSRRFLPDSRVQPFREVFAGYELLAYLSMRAPRLGFRTVELPVTRAYPAHGLLLNREHGLDEASIEQLAPGRASRLDWSAHPIAEPLELRRGHPRSLTGDGVEVGDARGQGLGERPGEAQEAGRRAAGSEVAARVVVASVYPRLVCQGGPCHEHRSSF